MGRAHDDATLGLIAALRGVIGLVELIVPTLQEPQKSGVQFNPRLADARDAIKRAMGAA